jgi:hypothetical protein
MDAGLGNLEVFGLDSLPQEAPSQLLPEIQAPIPRQICPTQGIEDLSPHRIPGSGYGWPQVDVHLPGRDSESPIHCINPLLHNPRSHTSPSGVEKPQDAGSGLHQEDGDAIGNGHGKKNACLPGEMPVPWGGEPRCGRPAPPVASATWTRPRRRVWFLRPPDRTRRLQGSTGG